MRYEITGGNLPVVICYLQSGEGMITESGSMSWMSPNMKMETVGGGMKKMLGRAFSGENAFQNRYSAQGGDGMIAFASSFPGSVNALEIRTRKEHDRSEKSISCSGGGRRTFCLHAEKTWKRIVWW